MFRGKFFTVMFVFLLCASAFSQTNLSSRPAGFIKLNVPAQGYVLASVPFYMLENGTDELRNSLASSQDKDKADCLLLWDNSTAKYITLINSGTNWVNRNLGGSRRVAP
jgi:hypothetical protein